MEEIKVGEYVRCKNGKIAKIKRIENEFMYFDKEIYWKDGIPIFELENVFKDFIVKHSPNIIDLIEKGDYVNGKLVTNVDKVEGRNYIEWEDGDMYSTEIPNDKFIENIVTKEQFEQRKYVVEE